MPETELHIAPKSFSIPLIEKVGSIGKVLSEFLDSERRTIQTELKREYSNADNSAIELLLNAFVTVDGTKKPLKLDEIQVHQITREQLLFCLNRLERGRILRLDDDTYELAHDTLAGHIHSQRSAEEIGLLEAAGVVKNRWKDFEKTQTLMNSKEVDLVSVYVDTLETRMILTADELEFVRRSVADVKRKRTARRVTIAVIMIALLGLSVWALTSRKTALVAQKKAEALQQKTEEQYADILESNFRADQSQYTELLNTGNSLMALDPPDYDAAFELFEQAKLIADRRANDSMQLNLFNEDGRDAFELALYADKQKELEPLFDSLMTRGLEIENTGYENYLTALGYYTRALEMKYNKTRAEKSIELIRAKLPMAFESLRKDGDVYFDVGEKVSDPQGYRNALIRYRQASAIRVPNTDWGHVESRIQLCQAKLGEDGN